VAHDNTIGGFSVSSSEGCIRCIADTNTGASSDGFLANGNYTIFVNCTAYNNGRHGINASSASTHVENCLAESNGGYGITAISANNVIIVLCGTYNNTSGGINTGTGLACWSINPITGSGSFFTNAAGQDFTLNATTGAGASARAAGYPGVLDIGGTGYLDIGALQHQDPVGGGGSRGRVGML
jgi:hypothetical protein